MNRNRTLLTGILCAALLLSLGTSWGANRYYYSPETLKVGQGASFEWHLMLEADQGLCGYGFASLAPVEGTGDQLFVGDTITDNWIGTAADPNLTIRVFGYSKALDAYGGAATGIVCPPGASAGTHIAVKLIGQISGTAPYGVYTFSQDVSGNTDMTDEGGSTFPVPMETGYIEVIEHQVELEVFDCPTDSIEEDVVTVITVQGSCTGIGHTGTLTVDVAGGMPDWADFATVGTNPVDGTLTLTPGASAAPWEGTFVFTYIDNDTQEELTAECYVKVWDSVECQSENPSLEFKKVLANPGQQHVCVPIFLTNMDFEVNAFEVLFDYDPTALTFVGVSDICAGCDVIMANPCWAGPDEFFPHVPLFDTDFRPEYFHFTHGVGSHPNWVRVVGIMDMDWPQPITPPIPPGCQQMIFCAIFDVSPLWDGQEVFFNFKVTDCTDNTLADYTGYQLWGPNADELPDWLDCNYDSVLALVDGNDGCAGIGIRSVLAGDLNCNEIQCEVGDAVVFINYLVYGAGELCGDACVDMYGDNCAAAQGAASDMNGDGYFWTIADLVGLLNCVNGYVAPPAVSGGPVDVMMSDDEVRVSTDAEIAGAYFTVEYEGDATPELTVPGMEMKYHGSDGVMHVVIYSMESARIPAGNQTLFTLPGITTIKKADLADASGNALGVSVFTKPSAGFAIQRIVPNPVRQGTADIFFSVPVRGEATLKVYDSAGRVVTTLVNGTTSRGLQKATWDATDHANGVYFCRLESDSRTTSKKIVLMK